ncbi:ABC transporter permease [Subtercola endophyticus]|uniref:ABC transporter permease n=1 Tax=Subtercola endophyticus TaxID=2895559 RepID=UPI001E2A5E84|nr:FtsX-like permease family protein [Subtercola endophyticus]UFS61221.1 FtsX-like permease family protein [Subtercola endophyticus]
MWALRELRVSAGRYAASVAVVAVVAAFAVLLLESIEVFVRALQNTGLDDDGVVRVALTSVGAAFLGIAVLTAAIVISGTFQAVYAGRIRDIALLRLVGATSRQVRRASRIDGLAVGIAGGVVGVAAGVALALAAIAILNASTDAHLVFVPAGQVFVVPAVVCLVVSTLAAAAGAKRVASVSPVEATHSVAESRRQPTEVTRRRRRWGIALFVAGLVFLALGLIAGLASPIGLVVAFPGGTLSILGIVLGAPAFTAPLIVVAAGLITRTAARGEGGRNEGGRGATGRGELVLAGANLRLDAMRTARSIVAVVIGITLITMFTVAGDMYITQLRDYFGDAAELQQVSQGITAMLTVVYILTSFSVLVAAIGLASTLTLSVIQRRREIAVLRSVGLTARQARRMIVAESLIVSSIGAVLGLLLGVLYGFVGANATFGVRGFMPPVISPWFVVIILGATLLFSVLVSVLPGRRASRIAPAEALRSFD